VVVSEGRRRKNQDTIGDICHYKLGDPGRRWRLHTNRIVQRRQNEGLHIRKRRLQIEAGCNVEKYFGGFIGEDQRAIRNAKVNNS